MASVQVQPNTHCGEEGHARYDASEMATCPHCGKENCPDCLSYNSQSCYRCDGQLTDAEK